MLFHSWICRPVQLSRWDFILRDAGLYGTAWNLSIGAKHEKSFLFLLQTENGLCCIVFHPAEEK